MFSLLVLQDFRLNIVFRSWDGELIPEREIRCFVVDGRVTAMTQYYSSLFVPFLAENKAELQKRVLDYLEIVIPLVKLANFTIDVGIRKDLSLCVVEINPPAPRSGTSLFVVRIEMCHCFLKKAINKWNHGTTSGNKSDNDILLGLSPFEFRVLTAPIEEKQLIQDRKQTFEHFQVLGIELEQDESKCAIF